jgi:hypothetical protein
MILNTKACHSNALRHRYPLMKTRLISVLALLALSGSFAYPETIAVKYAEGLSRGFVVLRNQDGAQIADGESTQVVEGDRVVSRLVFHFDDNSLYDDTTVFTQKGVFRLVSDHVIQKGPSFKMPMDTRIDVKSGQVVVRYTKDGKEQTLTEKMDFPPDVANGMIFTVIKDFISDPITLSYVATSPKPRMVKLLFSRMTDDTLLTGRVARKAKHFVMKVQIGGVAGVVAPVIGKQPPDTHLWVLDGQAPVFGGSQGPLSGDGPVWIMQLTSPARRKNLERPAEKRQK